MSVGSIRAWQPQLPPPRARRASRQPPSCQSTMPRTAGSHWPPWATDEPVAQRGAAPPKQPERSFSDVRAGAVSTFAEHDTPSRAATPNFGRA